LRAIRCANAYAYPVHGEMYAYAKAASYTSSETITRLALVHRLCNDAVMRVYDAAGNVIETHEHAGDFKEA
jgi:hypothetical protein